MVISAENEVVSHAYLFYRLRNQVLNISEISIIIADWRTSWLEINLVRFAFELAEKIRRRHGSGPKVLLSYRIEVRLKNR